MGMLQTLAVFAAEQTTNNVGLVAIGAAIAILVGFASSLGESWIACHAIDAMSRNPEMQGKLRSTMILAVALDESCAIYGFIISILLIFILGAPLVG